MENILINILENLNGAEGSYRKAVTGNTQRPDCAVRQYRLLWQKTKGQRNSEQYEPNTIKGVLVGTVQTREDHGASTVTVYYKTNATDCPPEWHRVEAKRVETAHNGVECLWQFTTPLFFNTTYKDALELSFEFYVERHTDIGVVLKDDNGGKLYAITKRITANDSGESGVKESLAPKEVLLDMNLPNTIIVKNLTHIKDVWVHYSNDYWRTIKHIPASFHSMIEDWEYERWSFEIPDALKHTQFAVSYRAMGITYWDNNFDNNYKIVEPDAHGEKNA